MTAIIILTLISIITNIYLTVRLKKEMLFNHSFTVKNLGSIFSQMSMMSKMISDELTEHQRKVGTFKTTVLTDMSAYHRELVGILADVKEEDYKNSDHLRKLIEETTRQIDIKIAKTQMQLAEVASHITDHVSTNFENTSTHISSDINKVMDKVNSESDEIKTFVKHMHDTSIKNHTKADTKIEAVFQRVNSGLGIPTVKKIPSL
jgi:gas vesicle protein